MVADLQQRKDKVSGCFKNDTSVVLHQCQNQVNFQIKGSSINRVKIFAKSFEGLAVLSIHKRAFYFLKKVVKIQCDARTLSLKIYFILALLADNRSAVFEATTNFAFSPP